MALIQDPLVVTWSNEQLRPIAEQVYKVKAMMDQAILEYEAGVEAVVTAAAGTDVIEDNAYKSGKHPETADEAEQFMLYVKALAGVLDGTQAAGTGPDKMPVFELPMVRAVGSLF